MNIFEKIKLIEATNKVTFDMLVNMRDGDTIALNDEYTLFHYYEDGVIVLLETEGWEEIFQMMYNPDTKEVFFESLI